MIIHNYKLIIITPPKTGSVSITEAVKDHLLIDRWMPQSNDCFDFIETGHQKASKHNDIRDYVEYIKPYYVVGCVRNPYERMVSWWSWFKNPPFNETNLTFYDFVTNKRNFQFIDINQLDFLSIDGKCFADDWIKFESLNSDFKRVGNIAGMPTQPLPHRNKTKHKHYTEYYNNDTLEIVTNLYQKDIDYFGYKFGE